MWTIKMGSLLRRIAAVPGERYHPRGDPGLPASRPSPARQAWFDPDSAHFIMWDPPARFQAELKAFLNGG